MSPWHEQTPSVGLFHSVCMSISPVQDETSAPSSMSPVMVAFFQYRAITRLTWRRPKSIIVDRLLSLARRALTSKVYYTEPSVINYIFPEYQNLRSFPSPMNQSSLFSESFFTNIGIFLGDLVKVNRDHVKPHPPLYAELR